MKQHSSFYLLSALSVLSLFLWANKTHATIQVKTEVLAPQTPPSTRPGNATHRPRARPKVGNSGAPKSEDADKFVSLGDTFLEKNKWKAAEAAYREAIKIVPGDGDAWAGLGQLYVGMSNFGAAYRVRDRLRSLDPGLAEWLNGEIKDKERSSP